MEARLKFLKIKKEDGTIERSPATEYIDVGVQGTKPAVVMDIIEGVRKAMEDHAQWEER
jgi:hypothetical protein